MQRSLQHRSSRRFLCVALSVSLFVVLSAAGWTATFMSTPDLPVALSLRTYDLLRTPQIAAIAARGAHVLQ
jgi:hypothetical protein